MVQPAGSGLAVVDHAGGRGLARDGGRGSRLARAVSGHLPFPPATFERGAWTPEQAHLNLMPQRIAARRYDRCLRPAPMRLSPSAWGRDVSMTRISACRVSTDQNQTAAAKDRAVPLAFNSAALADHITSCRRLPGSPRDGRFLTQYYLRVGCNAGDQFYSRSGKS